MCEQRGVRVALWLADSRDPRELRRDRWTSRAVLDAQVPVIVPGAERRLTDAGVGRCRSGKAETEGRRRQREEEEEEEAVKEEKNRAAFAVVLVSRKTVSKSGEEWDGGVGVAKCADPDAVCSTNADWV